ncbi:MAG: hypothetical protein ACK4ST_13025, partial [Elioraea tepidiphila]
MRTLFLGATGGDLASEAALAEALSAFPSSAPVLLGLRPTRLSRAFPGLRAVLGIEELGRQDFARAVLVGPQRNEAAWLGALALLGSLAAAGTEVHVHNLGLSEFPAMLDPPAEGRAVLARAGRGTLSELRWLADTQLNEIATPIARGQLGAALAHYGEQARAEAMVARAGRMLDAPDP